MKHVETVRRALLVLSIAFLVLMGLSIRPAGTRPLEAGGEVAETLVREAAGLRDRIRFRDFVWDEQRKEGGGYRLRAAEALGFPDSGDEVFRLKDVRFETAEDEAGRNVSLSAPRAEFRQSSREVRVFDGVSIEGQGVRLRSASFRYDPGKRTFTSGEAVTALRGELVARADHGVLETGAGSIRLAGSVRVRGRDPSGRLLDLAAPEAVLRKGGSVEATGGVVVKTPEALLRARSFERTAMDPAAGGGDRMKAWGEAFVLALPGRDRLGSPAQADAETLELIRDSTGAPSVVTAERSPVPAVLRVGPSGEAGARRAESARFEARFARGKVSELTSPGHVIASETAPASGEAGSGLRTLDAGYAKILLRPDGRGLASAAFEKGVTLTDGTRALLRASTGFIEGPTEEALFTGSGGRLAFYRDEKGTVEAATMKWKRREEVLDAQGSVRTTQKGGGSVSIPGGESGEPYYSESDRLRLQSRERTATLSGNVRVWQKENVLRCAVLVVKDSDRSVRAEGSVRASVRRKTATGDRATETVNLSGDRLTHKEADRLLTIDGNAAVASGAWSLASEVLDIRLSPAREIESGDARGKVVVEDRATRRRGEGKHATWEARGETVTLEGDPATAIDGKGNRLTGARLTFRQGQSRVDVESKPGVGSEGWFRPEGS